MSYAPRVTSSVNAWAAALYAIARRRGGAFNNDSVVRLSFQPYGPDARRWVASLAVDRPRARGRWRYGEGASPEDAVSRLYAIVTGEED